MKICRVKATKRIIEMQGAPTPGLLTKNALGAFGLTPDKVEELEVTPVGYEAAKAEDPVEIALKAQIAADAKAKEDAKVMVNQLEADVPKAKDIDELKVAVLDLINCVKVLT